MSGYQVHIHELARLVDVLAEGAEQVREANKTLAAAGQLDMLGHDSLRGEAHEFEEKWRWGLDKLDEAAEGVIDRLRETKSNYEALEDEYSGLFDKILAETGPAPGGVVPGGPAPGGQVPAGPAPGGQVPTTPAPSSPIGVISRILSGEA